MNLCTCCLIQIKSVTSCPEVLLLSAGRDSTHCSWLLDVIAWASVLLITLLFYQSWWRSQPWRWWITLSPALALNIELLRLLCFELLSVRPRVRRHGEWSTVISLIVFQELFFLMCLWFCWNIINPSNGHSWGFVPSAVISCKTDQPADGKHYLSLRKIKTKVSLSASV